jgi:heat shock factor-binding protein 1
MLPFVFFLFLPFQVENLLEQMNSRFKAMSDTIIGRIDEMGGKIEELEKSVNDLLAQTTASQQQQQQAPPK